MFTLREAIEIDEQGFWKVYFDEAFGRALHCDFLQFPSFEIAEQHVDEHGVMRRRVDYRPRVAGLQKLAVKLVGDGSYSERGRYDPHRRTYIAEFAPKQGPDTFVSRAELRVAPLSGRRCEFQLTVSNKANVRGMSWLVESAAEKMQRRANEEAVKFMNQWIRDRGL